MTAWSLDSATLLAHTVHYALVVGGLVGLSWLLLPQLAAAVAGRGPVDDHERRVAALRSAVADGSLLTLGSTARPTTTYAVESTLLAPVLVVCSAAAAGVHAAMGPAHVWTVPAFGLFFVAAAAAQLSWTVRLLLRPSVALLHLGVLLNASLVGLWLVTRTAGLPLGLMPVPEPVGPWDLASVAWELGALAVCLRLLGRGSGPVRTLRLAPVEAWHRGALAVLAASAGTLVLLSLGGVCG